MGMMKGCDMGSWDITEKQQTEKKDSERRKE